MTVLVTFDPLLVPTEDLDAPTASYPLTRADHEAMGDQLLPVQFRNSPNMKALVRSRSTEAQEIEDAILQLMRLGSIDDNEGEQLDVIGRLVRQPREYRDDTRYRVWLKVRIRLRRCHGTPGEVFGILRLAVGDAALLSYFPQPPAAFTARVLDLAEDAAEIREILTLATMAGVRSLLVYSARPPEEVFRFDSGPGLDQGHLAGVLE